MELQIGQKIRKLTHVSPGVSALLALSLMQGYLLLLQLSRPLSLISGSSIMSIISLSTLSLALTYSGRALGILFSAYLQRFALALAIVSSALTYVAFSHNDTVVYLVGAFIFGIAASSINIFSRKQILILEEGARSVLFSYILMANIVGMWLVLTQWKFVILIPVLAAIAHLLLSRQQVKTEMANEAKLNLLQTLALTVQNSRITVLRTVVLILMVSLFNASIFVKLRMINADFNALLLSGLSMITLGVVIFKISNVYLASTLKNIPSAVLDTIYIGFTLLFFFSTSKVLILVGIPIAYCFSQHAYLSLLKESQAQRLQGFSIFYEATGFLTGILFSLITYTSKEFGLVVISVLASMFCILSMSRLFISERNNI